MAYSSSCVQPLHPRRVASWADLVAILKRRAVDCRLVVGIDDALTSGGVVGGADAEPEGSVGDIFRLLWK
eukprot:11158035-Lingulodinium_polyedra.AAC.1